MTTQGNSLDSLPETHLVSQDTVQIVVMQRNQPLQTLYLDTDGSVYIRLNQMVNKSTNMNRECK